MLTYTEAKEAINDIGRSELERLINEGILEAAVNCGAPVKNIEECYQGQWDNDKDFVMEITDKDIPSGIPACVHIDWDRTTRDVMMDYSEDNGHYFKII